MRATGGRGMKEYCEIMWKERVSLGPMGMEMGRIWSLILFGIYQN